MHGQTSMWDVLVGDDDMGGGGSPIYMTSAVALCVLDAAVQCLWSRVHSTCAHSITQAFPWLFPCQSQRPVDQQLSKATGGKHEPVCAGGLTMVHDQCVWSGMENIGDEQHGCVQTDMFV